jgi:5-methylcytosine-specific restriction endonuclease McrA
LSTTDLPPGKEWRRAVYGTVRITGAGSRTKPRQTDRQRVYAQQQGRCLYCDLPIDAEIHRQLAAGNRRNGMVKLLPHWDHFVPYSYLLRNPSANWILACHVCNGIKLARMFDSVELAREFILPERIRKGYEEPDAVIHRLRMQHLEDFEAGVRKPTNHQLRVLQMAADGMSAREIANKLEVRDGTIRDVLAAAAVNLRVRGLDAAIEAAQERGFIERRRAA